MEISGEDVCVMRVLTEDDRFMTVEIAKSDSENFTLNEDTPDEFHTFVFLRHKEGNVLEVWKPWQP